MRDTIAIVIKETVTYHFYIKKLVFNQLIAV